MLDHNSSCVVLQMYIFLPEVINTYSGMTFQEFVTERIFAPLNMTSTTYNLTEAEATGHMSQSWIFTGRRIPIIFQDPTTTNLIAGAGGAISNAIDMVSRDVILAVAPWCSHRRCCCRRSGLRRC